MKLCILGEQGPFPGADGATSGYLLTIGNKNILIDCGCAVIPRLLKYIDLSELDAVVISHLHFDHISDLPVLSYALSFSVKRNVPIYLPDGPQYIIDMIRGFNMLDVISYNSDSSFNLDDIKVEFAEMTHPAPSYAVKISFSDEKFVFSGDTNKNDALPKFAKNADIFLCNCGLIGGDIQGKPHLSAKQAAIICKQSGATQCILTHFSPLISMEDYKANAKKYFTKLSFATAFDEYRS